MRHALTIEQVANAPDVLSRQLRTREGDDLLFRPLLQADVESLAEFLRSLSARSRARWNLESYDIAMAREHCAAIGRYDKLRMVAVKNVAGRVKIVALMEFSFSIPPGDRARFLSYGIRLDETFDCRFAPCVSDDFQRRGIASDLLESIVDIARRFGKRRVMLWGGVFADNVPAISFYRKHGFIEVGRFTSGQGMHSLDFMLTLPRPPDRVAAPSASRL